MIDQQEHFKIIYIAAIKMLTRQDYSRYKLSKKLESKGFCENLVEEVLDKVTAEGFLREDYYIEARVKSLMYRFYSKEYIYERLQSENVNLSLQDIDNVFSEYNYTENEQIVLLLNKKLSTIDKNNLYEEQTFSKVSAKLINYILSKGHEIDLVENSVNKELNNLKNF